MVFILLWALASVALLMGSNALWKKVATGFASIFFLFWGLTLPVSQTWYQVVETFNVFFLIAVVFDLISLRLKLRRDQ